jgi:hypothetical protein
MAVPVLNYAASRTTGGFWKGFLLGLLASVVLNLLPYLFTYHAYFKDGYEYLGFPFTFRRVGGYPIFYVFDAWLLIGDILIAIAVAGAVGIVSVSRRGGGHRPAG